MAYACVTDSGRGEESGGGGEDGDEVFNGRVQSRRFGRSLCRRVRILLYSFLSSYLTWFQDLDAERVLLEGHASELLYCGDAAPRADSVPELQVEDVCVLRTEAAQQDRRAVVPLGQLGVEWDTSVGDYSGPRYVLSIMPE